MKRILIIRTIQAELIDGLIDKWKAKFPNATFDILRHNGQPNIGRKVDKVHLYNAQADFSWRNLNKASRKKLKGYDVVIFPHKWKSITGFHDVIELAIKLRPKEVYHSNKHGELQKIDKRIMVWILIRKALIISGFLILVPLLTLLLLNSLRKNK